MHCHMEIHQLEGMAMIIEEGEQNDWPEYEGDEPRCFLFDYEKEDKESGAYLS